jgi:hypothetical protein
LKAEALSNNGLSAINTTSFTIVGSPITRLANYNTSYVVSAASLLKIDFKLFYPECPSYQGL